MGTPADHIVEDVMVGHLADGIGARVAAEANGHDHFFRIELAFGLSQELRAGDGMEHPLEVVLTRHHRREGDKKKSEHEQRSAPAAGGSPQREGEKETGDARDQRAQRERAGAGPWQRKSARGAW